MRQTGIDLLAADLGTTPEGLAMYIALGGLALIAVVVLACWKLSRAPAPEGFPSDPRPKPRKKAA